jgi:CheY-like chemotaxis protein
LNTPLTLLVVEDNPGHLADLHTMLSEELPQLPIQIVILEATDLGTALTGYPAADAILTDVFFPDTRGGDAEVPNGQKIVERCLADGKPVQWITSTFHHDAKTEEPSRWGRERGLEMFDSEAAGSPQNNKKPWLLALYGVLYSAIAVEMGIYRFENGKIVSTNPVIKTRLSWGPPLCFFQQRPRKTFGDIDPVTKKMLDMGF